jgi:transcriptional regulator with XRE-family HTH domain
MTKVNLEKIKQLRKSQKLSQRDMADILGFNTLYPYHRKESGSQPFTADEIHTIAKYFNVPVEYFFINTIAKNATDRNTA